ncbi:Uu.00g103670.m01.CDS01 [Anthostomella pinea]|uniref:Uu.00g103670.m01.CDS01 n=1 Tax=Anthostomella pinea TaxID=933095 RepID=A0AAI8VE41_9PEZI|nr:Uu.00g103670.m01.CDS01 [Anthostomella pinea]
MKAILLQLLLHCAGALAVVTQQKPLVGVDEVPGHNNATYGPVPKNDQLFAVEFLEIAPTPIIADRVFFVYLRGFLPESKKKELGLVDESLADATLTVCTSVVYPNGRREEPTSVAARLKTTAFADTAHLVIRNDRGDQVDYLPSSGQSDLLLDFQLPKVFLQSGMWTFSVDARLGDQNNTCLFAVEITQWLHGSLQE